MGLFDGKVGMVLGVANDHSIAWAVSEALYAEGAELAFTHLPGPSSERPHPTSRRLPPAEGRRALRRAERGRHRAGVRPHARRVRPLRLPGALGRLRPAAELRSPYLQMSRAGWHLAMDISVYSLVAVCRAAAPLMTAGGQIITLTYYGGEKVVPGYNVMGVCKAALEHSVRVPGLGPRPAEHPHQFHQRRPAAHAQFRRHRRLRRAARARPAKDAAGPERGSEGNRYDSPLSSEQSFDRRHRRDDPRRLRLQHRGDLRERGQRSGIRGLGCSVSGVQPPIRRPRKPPKRDAARLEALLGQRDDRQFVAHGTVRCFPHELLARFGDLLGLARRNHLLGQGVKHEARIRIALLDPGTACQKQFTFLFLVQNSSGSPVPSSRASTNSGGTVRQCTPILPMKPSKYRK